MTVGREDVGARDREEFDSEAPETHLEIVVIFPLLLVIEN